MESVDNSWRNLAFNHSPLPNNYMLRQVPLGVDDDRQHDDYLVKDNILVLQDGEILEHFKITYWSIQ